MEKKDLKPVGVFKYFEEICQVPRPSKKEEKMIAYLKAFGDRKSTRLNSSHYQQSRMPSSA